jgi:hypothetical protein
MPYLDSSDVVVLVVSSPELGYVLLLTSFRAFVDAAGLTRRLILFRQLLLSIFVNFVFHDPFDPQGTLFFL